MKKLAITAFILFLAGFILPSAQRVHAACENASNKIFRPCENAAFPNRCVVGRSGTTAAVLCCQTPEECTTRQEAAQNPDAEVRITATTASASLCSGVTNNVGQQHCYECETEGGVWTAIGCITTDPNNLLSTILRIALGLAGGIAFLLILFGGLQIMTSAGNPEQLNAGRELISSAIIGLIIILFSIFLLQFIGVNIIGIPGFTS